MTLPAMKEFPWWCGDCGRQEIRPASEPYRIEARHDGELHVIDVPELRAPKCAACGNIVFGREEDEQVNTAIRERFGLLPPEEIRRRREALGIGRPDLAARLDVDEETLLRWESGALIQSTASDRLLRLCFDVPEARAYLGITEAGLRRADSAGAA